MSTVFFLVCCSIAGNDTAMLFNHTASNVEEVKATVFEVTYDGFMIGDIVLESDGERFVYRYWLQYSTKNAADHPANQVVPPEGEGIPGVPSHLSLAIGFDGTNYWIAGFDRADRRLVDPHGTIRDSPVVDSYRARHIAVIELSALSSELDSDFGTLLRTWPMLRPRTYSAFLMNAAPLHRFSEKLDLGSLSAEALREAIAEKSEARPVESERILQMWGLRDADVALSDFVEVRLPRGMDFREWGYWNYLIELEPERDVGIRRLFVGMIGIASTGPDSFRHFFPLPHRFVLARRKTEVIDSSIFDWSFYANDQTTIVREERRNDDD